MYYSFTRLLQRIFNCDKTQDKQTNFNRSSLSVITYTSYKLLKMARFSCTFSLSFRHRVRICCCSRWAWCEVTETLDCLPLLLLLLLLLLPLLTLLLSWRILTVSNTKRNKCIAQTCWVCTAVDCDQFYTTTYILFISTTFWHTYNWHGILLCSFTVDT